MPWMMELEENKKAAAAANPDSPGKTPSTGTPADTQPNTPAPGLFRCPGWTNPAHLFSYYTEKYRQLLYYCLNNIRNVPLLYRGFIQDWRQLQRHRKGEGSQERWWGRATQQKARLWGEASFTSCVSFLLSSMRSHQPLRKCPLARSSPFLTTTRNPSHLQNQRKSARRRILHLLPMLRALGTVWKKRRRLEKPRSKASLQKRQKPKSQRMVTRSKVIICCSLIRMYGALVRVPQKAFDSTWWMFVQRHERYSILSA